MTILIVASAMIDDLVESGSFLRTQVSACDYGVIDTSRASCAVILQPSQSTSEILAYGGVTRDTWGIAAECYIKVGGDPTDAMGKAWHMHDAVKTAVMAGSNVNTVARVMGPISMSKSFGQVFNLHGHDLLLVLINIPVMEDP